MTDLRIINRSGQPTLTIFDKVGTPPNWRDLSPAAVGRYLDTLRIFNETGSLRVYEPIGELMGIDAEKFARDLDQLGPIDTLDLYINSPGGSVFDGLAIHAILNRHPARKHVYVDGVAASIASVIAMAGDRIEMAAHAKLMIHNASGVVVGESQDMRELADLLDMLSETIAEIYAARSQQPIGLIKSWMADETWFSAAEAVEANLADVVTPAKGASNGHRPPQAEIERKLRRLDGAPGPTRQQVAARLREIDRRIITGKSRGV